MSIDTQGKAAVVAGGPAVARTHLAVAERAPIVGCRQETLDVAMVRPVPDAARHARDATIAVDRGWITT